jgi:autotransporter passenger strand-loop-strand repeat protein
MSGAIARGFTISSGGTLVIDGGYTLSGYAISAGAQVDVYGLAPDATVAGGGTLVVLAGGVTSGSTIESGGVGVMLARRAMSRSTPGASRSRPA